MGVSCGALQWNIGQGSLQPVVVAVGERGVRAAMPRRGAVMWRACNAPVVAGLKIIRAWQPGGKLPAPTRAELVALMGSDTMRRQQHDRIAVVAARPLIAATRWRPRPGAARRSSACSYGSSIW